MVARPTTYTARKHLRCPQRRADAHQGRRSKISASLLRKSPFQIGSWERRSCEWMFPTSEVVSASREPAPR
ncbi:hypothetical protein JG687_00018493 [Phytophthora cactorum]|uniref:Uncharacterized protein n=1 Tax=Phytophthora cactorum TaxID=29920 RepID=A0A8T1TKT8_9STRA|nr:hypothetical protein JG687_00018493 [Phytophthora cactorum]